MTNRLFGLLVLLFVTLAAGGIHGEERSKVTREEPRKAVALPEGKETTLGLYITAIQADEKWKANPDQVKVLDVPFPEEYVFVGHAEMAWHIPVALISYEPRDEKTPCSMKPNPAFVSEVKKWAQPKETLLVMCRSGCDGRQLTCQGRI